MSFSANNLIQNQLLLENTLKRRFIVAQSFEIYGGCSGLFDLGPVGTTIKNNILALWKKIFLLNQNVSEITCTNLTPYNVLKTSGHVDKFIDYMLIDSKTKEIYRADKVLKQQLEQIKPQTEEIKKCLIMLEGCNNEEIDSIIDRFKLKTPNGNDYSPACSFNLMFSTNVGPKNLNNIAYLRPETAQGIFVNFKRLYEQYREILPFGAAIIGVGFRNEISPRNYLLRLREFLMAEIEFFYDPEAEINCTYSYNMDKSNEVCLYTRDMQENNLEPKFYSIDQLLKQNIVQNCYLLTYMIKAYKFLIQLGINNNGIRFRQHLANELAHYSSDCWDAEILTSYGWVECIGIANRNAYDLTKHSEHTKVELVAQRYYTNPIIKEKKICILNKKVLGPMYKKNASKIIEHFDNYDDIEKLEKLANTEGKVTVCIDNNNIEIPADLMTFSTEEVKKYNDKFVPHVIEPSFGISRILQCLLEHSFHIREDKRTFFAFKPSIAPVQAGILYVGNLTQFQTHIELLKYRLSKCDITVNTDYSSVTIGRKYSRFDEIGIPFIITFDDKFLVDQTVTIREIVHMQQIRVKESECEEIIKNLITENTAWCDLYSQ